MASTTTTKSGRGRGKGSTMDTTAQYICPCGNCNGEAVTVTFVDGFAGTTCKVEACTSMRANGTVGYTVRRSTPMGWTPAGWASPTDDGSAMRHADGLVVFA